MLKKTLSILLPLCILFGVLTILPLSASAKDTVITDVGGNVEITVTSATRSQSEAVKWITDRGDEGWWENVDGAYGCQCVDLIMAYYQYFGYSRMSGYAYEYEWNHIPSGSNWYYSGTPIPGSVFVQSKVAAGNDTGHVGLVYAVDETFLYTVETNIGGNDDGYNGAEARYNKRYRNGVTTYINPDFDTPAYNAWLNISTSEIFRGESVTFTYGADNSNGLYTIGIDKGNDRILTENIWSNTYTYTFTEAGDYSAYVTCYGNGGLADTNRVYLRVYDTVPVSNAWIKTNKSFVEKGSSMTFTYGADNSTNLFTVGIDKDETRIHTENVRTTEFTYTFNEIGNYSAYVTCYGYNGLANTQRVYFTVGDFAALNIGESFAARMIHNATSTVVIREQENNVTVGNYLPDDDQLWVFEKMSDLSYKITNHSTGLCLEAAGAGTSDNTNVRLWQSNGSNAQRWFIRKNGNGYSLVPKHALNMAMDLYGGVADGANIATWTYSVGNNNQIFSFNLSLSPSTTSRYNNKKYELYDVSIPWKSAYKFCEQQGGHLVTINSSEEQNFVQSIISSNTDKKRLWLGANDLYSEGNWKWITNEALSYQNWTEGEPNNDNNEDYMMLYKSTGRWNDACDLDESNTGTYCFICEYENTSDFSAHLEKQFFYNNHKYEVYSDSIDWQTADRYCKQKGGHLVSITSEPENNKIYNEIQGLKNERYLIGLTDIMLEGEWLWTTDEINTYQNWADGITDNDMGIEDYAEILTISGKWNDLKGFSAASLNIGFICEYDIIPILGDVDDDGEVGVLDATYIQRYDAGLSIPISEETMLICGDIDGDEEVGVIDVTLIQRYDAGFNVAYPIGELIA